MRFTMKRSSLPKTKALWVQDFLLKIVKRCEIYVNSAWSTWKISGTQSAPMTIELFEWNTEIHVKIAKQIIKTYNVWTCVGNMTVNHADSIRGFCNMCRKIWQLVQQLLIQSCITKRPTIVRGKQCPAIVKKLHQNVEKYCADTGNRNGHQLTQLATDSQTQQENSQQKIITKVVL